LSNKYNKAFNFKSN